jgi:hypothetical protein
MQSIEKRIAVSREQFAILCSELILLEMAGHSPRTCTIRAFKAAGIKPPKPSEPTEIVIDEGVA